MESQEIKKGLRTERKCELTSLLTVSKKMSTQKYKVKKKGCVYISFTCLFFFSSEEREKNGNTFNNNITKLPVRSCSYFLHLMLNKFIIAMLAIK